MGKNMKNTENDKKIKDAKPKLTDGFINGDFPSMSSKTIGPIKTA